ncbi:efflux RND transporter periplasmic adaptor subunit [Methylobacterium sp. JK268]
MLLEDDGPGSAAREDAAAGGRPAGGRAAARSPRGAARRVGPIALLVAALALAAGWFFRDSLPPPVAQLMAQLGLAPQAAPETSAEAKDQAEAQPGDADAVTLDAEGRQRLGLAFGTAETRRIVRPIRVPGTVAFDERRVTHLRPRTAGRVLSLAVQPGDRVAAGDTLATLDAAGVLDARNGLAAARASLGEAEASEKAAEINVKRGKDLIAIGGIPQADLDQRQVALAKAHAATQSARAQVDLYTAQYERLAPNPGAAPGTSAIVSPIAGVVTSSAVTVGEVVDTTHDAFTVADPSRILVLASLYGYDIASVRPGDAATIEAPIASHPRFEGKVRSVNAALDPGTNTAPARIEITNPGGVLRANMFVSVEIAADLDRDGVTIPAAAVQQGEDGPIAFVRAGDDRFERRKLALGVQRADWVEVTEGIRPGETVVTAGSFGLKAVLMRSLLGSTD